MHHFPLECIANVIEWVENRQDLFNLLTVSKDVFLIAARRLYRDPIKGHTNSSLDNLRKLVFFLLSTRNGRAIDTILENYDLPPPGTPLNPQPMIDYLSLIKVVRWREQGFDIHQLWDPLGYNGRDLCRHLTWAFVGHRLEEVEEIEIDVDDKERYLADVAKMTRVRRIWICLSRNKNYYEMYEFSEVMIKAIQQHHGPHHLLECQMIPNPLVEGPALANGNSWHLELDLSGVQRVLSLLPPPKHYLTIPRPDGTIVTLDHPLDPYVVAVQHIDRFDENTWNTMMKMHPDHSDSQILQRFRGMIALYIHPNTINGIDENLLDWAACEAEHSHYDGRQFAPLIRLEELSIDYKDYWVAPQSKILAPKWKILQDGLLGFASTLNKLRVVYPQSADGMTDRVFTTPRPLPKLKSLTIEGLAIDRSFWERAPNIKDLFIHFDYPQFRDSTTVDTTTTTATTTTGTTVATESQPQRQLPDFWFHCPNLTQLSLVSRAANLLDPNCLHFSPNLQRLELSVWTDIIHKVMVEDVDLSKSQGALMVLHSNHWTWNWSFPVLHSLILRGDLHEFRFSMGILRLCPTLKSIELRHCNGSHRFPLRVKGILDASMDKNNSQVIPFTHSNLNNINLLGFWDIEADELACLLQALPGLQKLEMKSARFNEGFVDRDLIEITKIHPALDYVSTSLVRTTEPASALGLSTSSTSVKDDREIPKRRTKIDYLFQYDSYVLYLQ